MTAQTWGWTLLRAYIAAQVVAVVVAMICH